MIRHLLLSVCLMFVTLPAVKAAEIDGIRIESPHRRVVVFVDGRQVCSPTFSCFVANLRGVCRVEVYESPSRGESPRKGKLLYEERVRCTAREVKEIFIPEEKKPGGGWEVPRPERPGRPGEPERPGRPIPGRPGRPGGHPDGGPAGGGVHEAVMSPPAFEQFMKLMKKQDFDSERRALLDNALLTSWFTTEQCIRLMEFCDFDSERMPLMKKMYPKIADKPNFFQAIELLDFSGNKKEINAFIKQYHEKHD